MSLVYHKCCVSVCLLILFLTWDTAASTARVYPAVLGSSVTLECSVRQEDKLVWDRGDGSRVIAVNGAFYPGVNTSSYLIQNTSVGQSLIIHSLSLIDDGTYRCYDLKNATNKQLMNVTILVEPPYVWSTGPNGIIEEGTKQVFICTADGGKPPPNMEWILIDRKANRKSFIGLNTDHRYTNGTYRRTNRLEIITSRDMYRASMICKVSISYFYEVQQTIVLDVNLYPLAPKFTDFTGLFDDGRVHNIECYSTGSRPAGSIYWQIDGNPVSSTADSTTKGADGLFYQSSTLSMRLTKNIQGQMLKCLVTNQVLQNQQKPDLFVQLMLLANFAPSIVADNGSRSVIEDNDVIMTCDVDARPLPVAGQFIWVHNGNPITSNSVYNITNDVLSVSKMTSTLHISPVSKASFGQYYCQASNHLGTQKSKVLTLDVQYRPVCAFQTKERHAGVLGKRLTLNCPVSSNPQNVTMTWRYVTRSSPPIRQNLAGLRMVNGFRYTTIDIDIRSASQFTDIECVATNSLGSSKAPCMYRIVKPGPPEIPHDCKSTATSDTEYVISCTPGFDGGYHQYFILQHLDDGQFHPSANNSDPNFTVQGLSQDKNFTYRVCSATDAFPQVTSCSNAIVISTEESPTVEQERAEDVESASTLPYIVGGICGFLVLLVIVISVIYCVRRKRQVCKRLAQKKPLSGKHSTPCMPTITDYFTHAQFQSVVAFPKNNLQENLHRQRKNLEAQKMNDFNDEERLAGEKENEYRYDHLGEGSTHSLIKSGSIDTAREHFYRQEQISNDVFPLDSNENDSSQNSSSRQRWNSSERLRALDASTRLEAIRVSTEKASINKTNDTSTPKLTNKEAEKMHSRSNSKSKEVDDWAKPNGSVQHQEKTKDTDGQILELSGPMKKEKDNMFLNLAFVHDEITDLDEFSHPRSPQVNLLAGSPRHEFCYSETDISAAITPNVNNPGVDTTIRKSRSHESLSDLRTANTLQLEKKHNYINLAYDRDSGDTEQLDDTGRNCNNDANLNDEDTGTQNSLYMDNSLKRSFVSTYSIQSSRSFDWTDQTNDIVNSDFSNEEMNTIPRRKSYNIAIGTANDGDKNPYKKEKIYDVPRISIIEGENSPRIHRDQVESIHADREHMDENHGHADLTPVDSGNIAAQGNRLEIIDSLQLEQDDFGVHENAERQSSSREEDGDDGGIDNHIDLPQVNPLGVNDVDLTSEKNKECSVSHDDRESESVHRNQHRDTKNEDNNSRVEISVELSGETSNFGVAGSLETALAKDSNDWVASSNTEENGAGIDIIVGSDTFRRSNSISEKEKVTDVDPSSASVVPNKDKEMAHDVVVYF